MEGTHHTIRSKSASSFEGHPQFQKHITVSRSPPDSCSYANASIRKDASLEVGQSSFGRAADRPLANLPAENVSKEPEPKRRTLSGFVRLLRRQGLPSLWSARKQKKKLSDSYQQKNTSNNIELNQELYDGQSSRRRPKQQQECSDVYEDLEASSFVSGRYSSRWNASSMLSKSEMALIQQNLDSKRLTYDETISEKFLESEDLDVTSDMLDSRDIMKKFGVKKKSSGNPVYDQQGTSSSSLGSPTALLNFPGTAKYGNAKSKSADGDVTGLDDITYHPNGDDGLLLDPHYRHRARTAHKMSDVKKCTLTTPILALKPDLGKMKNDHGSSPYHSQDYMPNSSKRARQPSAGSVKELAWRKTKSYYDAEFLDPVSNEASTEEAKRLAKKVTRRLRDACEKNEDAQYSGIKEYVTDESVYGAKESEIDKELHMLKWSSRSSFVDDNEWGSHASSRSINKEAKKRLAERWKITPKYRDLEILRSSSTLGEMLSTPDGERRSRKTASGHTDRSSKKGGSDNESSISRGGSKNKTERTSRSRSVPPISGSISGRGTCHDMLDNEKHLVQRSHDTDKVTKQCPSHKDHFSTQASKFYGKKPLPCPPIFIEEIDSSLEAMFKIQMEANVKDLPRQQLTFQMEDKDECSGGDVSETVAAEHGISSLLSKTSLLHPNDSPGDNERSSSTAHDQKDSCLQEVYREVSEESDPSIKHLGAEPVSSDGSKDADYASPIISVFETPLIEYASSSKDNSERVSAELKDLRLQLQLLKMESSFYDNHIPFDKDTISSGGWEASYTLDLLILAGLHDFGFDLFTIMWHSPECPLDIRLFNILEEKYRNEMAGSRPERMLLFDRINSAISVIFLKHVDVCPWEMSKPRGSLHLTWQKERARRTIEKLIVGLESANGMQATERIIDREMQWSDPMEEAFLTGNVIVELLINDLINELLFD